MKSTIVYAVGNEMQDVIQRSNEKAEAVFGRQLDIEFGEAGDVSASVECVTMPSESQGSRLGALLVGAGGGGAGFWLGNIILPGIGGLVGGLLGGLLGGLFSGGKRTEDVSSRIEAEFTLKLDAACKQTRPKIEELLHKAVAQYGESLKAAVEGKIKSLKGQAAEIKAKQEAGREAWDKHQAECRKALKTVLEVLSKMGGENVQ